jgi:hypothetical protein
VKSPHKKTEAASVIKIDLQALPPMDLFAKHIDAVLAALVHVHMAPDKPLTAKARDGIAGYTCGLDCKRALDHITRLLVGATFEHYVIMADGLSKVVPKNIRELAALTALQKRIMTKTEWDSSITKAYEGVMKELNDEVQALHIELYGRHSYKNVSPFTYSAFSTTLFGPFDVLTVALKRLDHARHLAAGKPSPYQPHDLRRPRVTKDMFYARESTTWVKSRFKVIPQRGGADFDNAKAVIPQIDREYALRRLEKKKERE